MLRVCCSPNVTPRKHLVQACVCVCTKLVYSNLYSYLQPSTTRATSPQKRETRHHRTRHRGKHTLTRQLYVIGTMRQRPEQEALQVGLLLCAPRSHAPALAPQQHEALWCDHSHTPASNTKPLCPTLCSSAGRQRVRSRSHAPLACSRYLFAPPYVCFRHSLAAEREGESQ